MGTVNSAVSIGVMIGHGTGMGTVNSAVSIGVMIGQVLGWVQLTVL